MTIYGVDISHWNGGALNFGAIAASGASYVFAKATEGGIPPDPTYATNRTGIEAAGMLAGAYHFLRDGTGTAQCDAFLATIGNPAGLLCALDVEAPGLDYGKVHDFQARWTSRYPDHPLFIYTGVSFGKSIFTGHSLGGPLWLAYYPSPAVYGGDAAPAWSISIGGVTPTLWQYGPRRVLGKNLDGDAYRGTIAQLASYADGHGSGPNVPGADVKTIQTNFPGGPRTVSFGPGHYEGWDPAKPGVPAKVATYVVPLSVCHAAGTATIDQTGNDDVNTPPPHGGPFLALLDGALGGTYFREFTETGSTTAPGAGKAVLGPAAPVFSQADVDNARAAGAEVQWLADSAAVKGAAPA